MELPRFDYPYSDTAPPQQARYGGVLIPHIQNPVLKSLQDPEALREVFATGDTISNILPRNLRH